jgi:hypothetical protein
MIPWTHTPQMLLNHGSSIVPDFSQIVQAVIWNRRLTSTNSGWVRLVLKKASLSIFVWILYSVQVVLRKVMKSENKKRFDEEQQENKARKANRSSVALLVCYDVQ